MNRRRDRCVGDVFRRFHHVLDLADLFAHG
jgi:hypothetical protein